MRVLIVSNGSIGNYHFYKKILKEADFIICADGGAKHLFNLNTIPNIIVGDLDSISNEIKTYYKLKNVEFIKFPTKKNATDTELATEIALSKKPSEIIYIGSIGNRMDHTLANILLLLRLIKKGVNGKIIDEKNEIYLVKDDLEVIGTHQDFLSLIPITEKVQGITLHGLEYPLNDAEIIQGSTLGISNKFSHNKAQIRLDSGLLLVIKSQD